jgi:sugar phosphate isomerase/epimerase
MQFVMFSKLLKDLSVSQLADTMLALGFDGFDLCVRPEYPINPENVKTALPAAAKEWKARGLTIGLVTTNFDFVDPTKPEVEPVMAACAEVGCRRIKLGYWWWRGESYWERVDAIRTALDGFQKLCAKHDVCVTIHTHSGDHYGSNCAGAMHLVKGFDPRYIGIYLDPGHLAISGEHLPMGFSMIKGYLCLVAVKSPAWFRTEKDGAVKWGHTLVPLREGMVDWKQVMTLLKECGYDGPISLHSEYEDLSRADLLARTRDDLAYLKGVAAEVG